MKRLLNGAAALLFVFILPLSCRAAGYLVPVGRVIGLQMRTDSVTVAAFDEVLGGGARDAGVRIGDELISVNGLIIEDASMVSGALGGKKTACVVLRRGSKCDEIQLPVHDTRDGPKLGIYLRQGIGGIGTVTWYDPETGKFGALGHGVSDSSGAILQTAGGTAYEAEIDSVKKGKAGTPGQLRGEAEKDAVCGELRKNTPQGVFGTAKQRWEGEPLPVASYEQLKTGAATILSTVEGDEPREYSVEIIKIYPRDRQDCRNLLLKVTDPALLNTTGGIVQGMSGSPIIQDGKLIGAVTHVLVNDPTTGYGIFIENMLDAAS